LTKSKTEATVELFGEIAPPFWPIYVGPTSLTSSWSLSRRRWLNVGSLVDGIAPTRSSYSFEPDVVCSVSCHATPNTEAVLFACLSSGWTITTGRLHGSGAVVFSWVQCFSMQVVMNKCFILHPEKNFQDLGLAVFEKNAKKHTLIPKNDVTEPTARLV